MLLGWFVFLSCGTEEVEDGDSSLLIVTDPQDSASDETCSQLQSPSCIEGFAPIPQDEPVFCMMICEAAIEQGVVSEVGQIPSSNVSFYDAQMHCSSLQINGIHARLPTFEEWIDAGDGVVGVGGSAYPWGDDFHSGECVLPMNGQTWENFQSCASLDTCVSAFGIYDQIGNLWEWVDAQMYVDITRWFAHQELQGNIFFEENGFLSINSDSLVGWYPFVVGLSASTLDVVDGQIWVRLEVPFRADLPGVGYLRHSQETDELGFLPIVLEWDAQRQNARIVVVHERDNEPIPAKVGGAHYSGEDSRLDSVFWGHVPTFDGSIGFRCVYDVLP